MLRRGIVSELGVFSATIFKKKNIDTSKVNTRLTRSPKSEAGLTKVTIVMTANEITF